MLSNSKSEKKNNGFIPVKPKRVAITDSTVDEDIVIYDECGDTLWHRVLLQADKTINPEQGKGSKAE